MASRGKPSTSQAYVPELEPAAGAIRGARQPPLCPVLPARTARLPVGSLPVSKAHSGSGPSCGPHPHGWGLSAGPYVLWVALSLSLSEAIPMSLSVPVHGPSTGSHGLCPPHQGTHTLPLIACLPVLSSPEPPNPSRTGMCPCRLSVSISTGFVFPWPRTE